MKNKIIDIICVCLVFVIFGSVAFLNIIQSNRPTKSIVEGRELAKIPSFSVNSLVDGSYFTEISMFISDTFLYRDDFVSLSKKMDTLRGVDYSIDGDDNFVVLGPTGNNSEDDIENDMSDKISEALDNLKNNDENEDDGDATQNQGFTPNGEIVDHSSDAENESHSDTLLGSDETEPDDIEPDDESELPDDETENENIVTAIFLSKKNLRLTVGSGAVVTATVESTAANGATVRWSVSDKNIATISINPSGGINVKGVAEGTCILTCSYNNELKEQCEITVVSINSVTTTQNDEQADFLTNGMFIYGDAVYTQAFYSASNAQAYAQTAAYYKTLFGDDTRVSLVVIPVSSMVVDNEKVKETVPDQGNIIDKMEAWVDPSVNFVDVYSKMYEHRDEYLFFKSDHHWTDRGAYYAYAAFAESIGLEPTSIDEFDYSILNDSYSGSLYSYTHDERVKKFVDTVEAFIPRKSHTMTVTGANGSTYSYNSCIVSSNKTYVAFIAGDNPYTVINVPENPQDKNILVLKDSFGNAFVPYLCEHYGNIIVVDVRYSDFNIHEQLGDYGITDIVFVNNIQAANSYAWTKMYMKAVGINLE